MLAVADSRTSHTNVRSDVQCAREISVPFVSVMAQWYETFGQFLQAARDWIAFSNEMCPHQSLHDLFPDSCALEHGFPPVPSPACCRVSNVLDLTAAPVSSASMPWRCEGESHSYTW